MAQISKELLELARAYIDKSIDEYIDTLNRVKTGKLKVLQTDHKTPEDAKQATLRRFEAAVAIYQQAKADLDAGSYNTDTLQIIIDFLRSKTKLKVPHNTETRELEMAMVSEFQDDVVETETHPRTKKEITKLISQKAETTNGDLTIRSMTEIDAEGRETTQALCVPTDSTWIQCRKM